MSFKYFWQHAHFFENWGIYCILLDVLVYIVSLLVYFYELCPTLTRG